MVDDELRLAERAWQAAPADQDALERWIAARYRAGLAVGLDLLERRVCPPRRLDLPFPARVQVELGADQWLPAGVTPSGGAGIAIPAHRAVWVELDDPAPEALRALSDPELGVHGVRLTSPGGEDASIVRHLVGAPLTRLHLHAPGWLGRQALAAVAALPRLASLELIVGRARLSAEWLAPLAGLRHLSRLELEGAGPLEPQALSGLAGAGALRRLALYWSPLPDLQEEETDLDLAGLAAACPALEELELECESNISDAGLRALGQGCRSLRSLRLRDPGAYGDGAVAALVGLPLRALELHGLALTDRCLETLAELPLEELALSGAALGTSLRALLRARPRLAVVLNGSPLAREDDPCPGPPQGP